MKYRRLTTDELEELETEFIQFLASNTVTGEDWEALKKDDAERAEELIDIFSDIVFEKVLQRIEYLEMNTPKDIRTFHCGPEIIRLNGLRVVGESDLDLTVNQDPREMMAQAQKSGATLQMYTGEKNYKPSRDEELFLMMQHGALISKDGFLFNTLEGLKSPPQPEG